MLINKSSPLKHRGWVGLFGTCTVYDKCCYIVLLRQYMSACTYWLMWSRSFVSSVITPNQHGYQQHQLLIMPQPVNKQIHEIFLWYSNVILYSDHKQDLRVWRVIVMMMMSSHLLDHVFRGEDQTFSDEVVQSLDGPSPQHQSGPILFQCQPLF